MSVLSFFLVNHIPGPRSEFGASLTPREETKRLYRLPPPENPLVSRFASPLSGGTGEVDKVFRESRGVLWVLSLLSLSFLFFPSLLHFAHTRLFITQLNEDIPETAQGTVRKQAQSQIKYNTTTANMLGTFANTGIAAVILAAAYPDLAAALPAPDPQVMPFPGHGVFSPHHHNHNQQQQQQHAQSTSALAERQLPTVDVGGGIQEPTTTGAPTYAGDVFTLRGKTFSGLPNPFGPPTNTPIPVPAPGPAKGPPALLGARDAAVTGAGPAKPAKPAQTSSSSAEAYTLLDVGSVIPDLPGLPEITDLGAVPAPTLAPRGEEDADAVVVVTSVLTHTVTVSKSAAHSGGVSKATATAGNHTATAPGVLARAQQPTAVAAPQSDAGDDADPSEGEQKSPLDGPQPQPQEKLAARLFKDDDLGYYWDGGEPSPLDEPVVPPPGGRFRPTQEQVRDEAKQVIGSIEQEAKFLSKVAALYGVPVPPEAQITVALIHRYLRGEGDFIPSQLDDDGAALETLQRLRLTENEPRD